MVAESIASCDNDLRKEFYRSIVLTGGSSLFPALSERLTQEVSELAPTQLRKDVKVVASTNSVERKFSVFIGGSILGSLGTFHQMWMSKGEYGTLYSCAAGCDASFLIFSWFIFQRSTERRLSTESARRLLAEFEA